MSATPISGTGTSESPYVLDKKGHLDFSWDWTDWLTPLADTIADKTVEASEPSGLAVTNPTIVPNNDTPPVANMMIAAWVDLGTAVVGVKYRLPCKMTSVAGRVDRRSVYIKIVER